MTQGLARVTFSPLTSRFHTVRSDSPLVVPGEARNPIKGPFSSIVVSSTVELRPVPCTSTTAPLMVAVELLAYHVQPLVMKIVQLFRLAGAIIDLILAVLLRSIPATPPML